MTLEKLVLFQDHFLYARSFKETEDLSKIDLSQGIIFCMASAFDEKFFLYRGRAL
jgi:hypothetical protein